jgi:PH (Pleckstrin Homology) domain-containing protein
MGDVGPRRPVLGVRGNRSRPSAAGALTFRAALRAWRHSSHLYRQASPRRRRGRGHIHWRARGGCNDALAVMIGRHSDVLLNPSMERRVIRVRRWAVLLSVLVGGIAGLRLVQSLLWYIAVGALVRLAWKVLDWWHELLVVTDKRFMVTSGIIQTKNSMMPITKVTDMSFIRPFLGRYWDTVFCG